MKIQVIKCSVPGSWYENFDFPSLPFEAELLRIKDTGYYTVNDNHSHLYLESDCIVVKEAIIIDDSRAGKKDDQGKLRYDLYPLRAYEGCTAVLTFGAKKYTPQGWRTVPDPINRYYAALIRHLNAQKEYADNGGQGLALDSESGLPHLDHAQCCLVFLRELS